MELLVIFALVAIAGLVILYRKKKRSKFPPSTLRTSRTVDRVKRSRSRWIALALLLLIGAVHYAVEPLASQYADPARASRALFYVAQGIKGICLFGLIAFLALANSQQSRCTSLVSGALLKTPLLQGVGSLEALRRL